VLIFYFVLDTTRDDGILITVIIMASNQKLLTLNFEYARDDKYGDHGLEERFVDCGVQHSKAN
jgi:hypothetical protein